MQGNERMEEIMGAWEKVGGANGKNPKVNENGRSI